MVDLNRPLDNHIIIVGDTPLAYNTMHLLTMRNIPISVIWREKFADISDIPVSLIIGDASDPTILQSAGIEKARALLAMNDDDSENAFVVLAARELNKKVKTVAVVDDGHNLKRMKRVHPDVILALPVLGGNLLAAALSGQEMRADVLIDQLKKLMSSCAST